MARKLDFPVFDADNHFYETTDAFTRYLPAEYADVIKYVEVKGRTKLAIKNRITDYIPNPTFNVVAPPGAHELKYKLENPDSVTQPGDKPLQEPPRSIKAIPAFFEPEARIELLNELGIDRALMWPTLASVLEERLADDPVATHAMIHAFNQWMLDHWSLNVDDRIFPVPVVTLPIVDRAIAEFEWLVERGAKIILVRPAPVPDFNGRRRSFALPEFDRFWKRVEEADVVVGMHASDSGTNRYVNEFEGRDSEFLPFVANSGFVEYLHAEVRMIADVVASIIAHGMTTRFPKLRILPVENGSAWVRPLLERFEKVYARKPELFDEDPVAVFKRNVWVHPFHEEDPKGLIDLVGVDRVCFGSDYPHPEGLYDPLTYVDDIAGLPKADQARIMGGNLAELMRVAA
ncbi:MAG: amidohydrolase family protein [Planctomycetota bacterium]|jgi:predicted TIM-barrel fold metal-dependent hydrolase